MLFSTPFKRLLLGAALALGLVTTAHAADLQPLRVANQKSTIKALLEASGETKNVPYEIKWAEFPSASPLGEALNAGAVDIGALGDAPYVFALGAGASLKVVSIIHAEGRNTTALLVPKDSPIKTVADLKGKNRHRARLHRPLPGDQGPGQRWPDHPGRAVHFPAAQRIAPGAG